MIILAHSAPTQIAEGEEDQHSPAINCFNEGIKRYYQRNLKALAAS